MSKEAYENFKKSRWFPLIVGVVCIVFGILCLANPEGKMEMIALFLGLAFLFSGLMQILSAIINRANKKIMITGIIFGLVLSVLAIIIFVNLELIGKYLPTLVGFVMVLSSLYSLYRSISALGNGSKSGWLGLVLDIVVLVLGILFIVSSEFVGKSFGIFSGIVLLLDGVSNLINFVMFK